jgi:hypothetical protein
LGVGHPQHLVSALLPTAERHTLADWPTRRHAATATPTSTSEHSAQCAHALPGGHRLATLTAAHHLGEGRLHPPHPGVYGRRDPLTDSPGIPASHTWASGATDIPRASTGAYALAWTLHRPTL